MLSLHEPNALGEESLNAAELGMVAFILLTAISGVSAAPSEPARASLSYRAILARHATRARRAILSQDLHARHP